MKILPFTWCCASYPTDVRDPNCNGMCWFNVKATIYRSLSPSFFRCESRTSRQTKRWDSQTPDDLLLQPSVTHVGAALLTRASYKSVGRLAQTFTQIITLGKITIFLCDNTSVRFRPGHTRPGKYHSFGKTYYSLKVRSPLFPWILQ